MISLAHSKRKYVSQLKAHQQEFKKNPNSKGRQARAHHAITMRLGPLDRGLFVRMTGGFEGRQYEKLTVTWEKATTDGNFDFCKVSAILAFLRRSTAVLSSASFPKDPPSGTKQTKQKTQTPALADFALQLDAVSASKNGQRLFGSAHALFVAAFVNVRKDTGTLPPPPPPPRSMVAQAQPQQPQQPQPPPQPQQPQPPQHGQVHVYENGMCVQYINGRGWIQLAPVERQVPQFFDDGTSDIDGSPPVPEQEQQSPHLHGGGTGGMQIPSQQQWSTQPQVSMAGTNDGSVS